MCNGVNAAGGAGAAGNAGNAGNSTKLAATSVQAESGMPPAVLELSRFLTNSNVRLQ